MTYKKKNVKRLIEAAAKYANPSFAITRPEEARRTLAKAIQACVGDRKKKKTKEAEPEMYFARTSREDMHRRAQTAEGKLAKTLWWVERLLALHQARGEFAHSLFLVNAMQARGRDTGAATNLAYLVEQMTEQPQEKQDDTEHVYTITKAEGGSCSVDGCGIVASYVIKLGSTYQKTCALHALHSLVAQAHTDDPLKSSVDVATSHGHMTIRHTVPQTAYSVHLKTAAHGNAGDPVISQSVSSQEIFPIMGCKEPAGEAVTEAKEDTEAPASGNVKCSAARVENGRYVGPCTNKATTAMKKDGSPVIYRCEEHAVATENRWPSLWRRHLI